MTSKENNSSPRNYEVIATPSLCVDICRKQTGDELENQR